MGIQGLFPLLKSIHRTTELKKYAGETFGVDGYGWLHRGAIACAIELAQGKPTRKYVDFAMHRVRMFKYFGVTPYLVFDGDYLPSKAKTESSREKRREQSLKTGLELLKAGKPSKAHMELQKAIDVTPEMARHLIEELKKAGVPYIVAPYEADAQLVYLERQGIIGGIVSEDSDMLVFGAKRLLTKMDQHGQCVEIQRKDFCLVREISLTGWTDTEFRHMAILSGCDYLDAVNNIGLKTAYRLIRKHKTPERIIQMLRFEGKHRVPENYLEEFKQAELTFLHQRVFCPKKQDIVFFTEPGPALNVDEMPFIGAPVETDLAQAIAAGDVNPITKKRIVLPSSRASPPSPGKRRISQTMAPVTVPTRNPGKPINEYFAKHKRIPLGEMDANCFNVNQNGASPSNSPRPIVFPLPRPYIEGVEEPTRPSRRYVNLEAALGGERRRRSEPISNLLATSQPQSSQHRRRTTGPIVDIFQDPSPSTTRPPKKARLCDDDLPTLTPDNNNTPVRSKFFSSTQKAEPTRKEADLILSDDSIEDAFRSLPEFNDWSSNKASQSGEVAIFEEESMATRVGCEQEEIEVPASSPVQPAERVSHRQPSSTRALGELITEFSYATTQSRTRIVHGLPSPVSSLNTPSTSKSSTPSGSQTPILTPLQRLGFQALQRGKPRAVSSSIPQSTRSLSFSKRSSSLAVNPASIPLPRADLAEIEALSQSVGSEDLILPSSDGELEQEDEQHQISNRGLDLSRFNKDRLRDHAKAFDGLLSLIPSKLYYGEDTSDQWKKKKQTKEEARAAKRGKLDPDSELHRNAKDVMEERARNKRKLKELEDEDDSNGSNDDDDFEIEGIEKEKPLEGLKKRETTATEDESPVKKQKLAEEPAVEQIPSKPVSTKESKKSAKKQKKEEAKRLKTEAATPSKPAAEKDEEPAVQESTEAPDSDREDDEMVPIDVSGLVTKDEENASGDESESTRDTPASDAAKTDSVAASSTTSISSAVPPSEKPKYLKIPVGAIDAAKIKEKLAAKILSMKIARKAADTEGNAIKNKNDLLESRRKLALKRKERKNEMRKQAKIEEEKKREAALATARDSPSLSSFLQDEADATPTNYAFGRLAFSDGTQLSHDAAYEKAPGSAKKKGPSDPKTALLKLENQKKRIANLPEEKQKQVLEQEAWLAARKRTEGEKVIDSETLLKKAIKRKEKGKKKSEKEWKERKEGVQKAIYDRQKKREENLQKRKDEKMANRRGKGKGKKNKGVQTKKKGGRPGFEGK
ncbi:hypothetical protein B0T21DRAFT_386296 [Apiosordaria backusii]|uniref:Exonuclease 1 n=1 Tax=Apiosordaria backusii TaxID=314023 RepID=A0AA40DYR4_9PEZI|nr:hypothetical protein B0T21DRAFT_386296 [Apiosordaria backusii]